MSQNSDEEKNSIKIFEIYAENLKRKFSMLGNAQPEAVLRPAVRKLIENIGNQFNLNIELFDEVNIPNKKVRPDIGVHIDELLNGYIELKAPGKGADPTVFKEAHNKEQWHKLKCLPNLIYTDGREWALFRNGKYVSGQPPVCFSEDPSKVGKVAISEDKVNSLIGIFGDFLKWEPDVPDSASELANHLAPLSKYLRAEVELKLEDQNSAISMLAREWRTYFPPVSDNLKFADAYAQTVTYALLLARFSGIENLEPKNVVDTLFQKNELLAEILNILSQRKAHKEILIGYELIRRTLEALKPSEFEDFGDGLWIPFYEEFIKKYDTRLRKELGVFHTDNRIVRAQIHLVSEILESDFGKKLGFADDGVTIIDPAVGTGTYLVEAVKHGLEKVEKSTGSKSVPARAEFLLDKIHGFELLVGPYTISHIRLAQLFEEMMNDDDDEVENDIYTDSKVERLNVYLADTLKIPTLEDADAIKPLHYQTLIQEHKMAEQLKNEGNILVCLGNPPYRRRKMIKENNINTNIENDWISLDVFTDSLTKKEGVHVKNIYNEYVYFWRWALRRVFEIQDNEGIVSFITPSSYLSGPGFAGMRKSMREIFDKLWILDLQGNRIGPRKTANVFDIQIPVAIAIGVRGKTGTPDKSAKVRYAKIEATTQHLKLEEVGKIKKFRDISWSICPKGWKDRFLPEGNGLYFDWPEIVNLFPWQQSGSQFRRTWPIAESKILLEQRWKMFCDANYETKKEMFVESEFRKIDNQCLGFTNEPLKVLSSYKRGDEMPKTREYGYRFLDRRVALLDNRFGDHLKPALEYVSTDKNIYFALLTNDAIGKGPAITASSNIPDIHFPYAGGNKDIFPLFKDAECNVPNITEGILSIISDEFGFTVSAQEFSAYVYAILGKPYVEKYWEELEVPVARVPITKIGDIFREVSGLGKKLLFFHTFGQRYGRKNSKIKGKAEIKKGIPHKPQQYPNKVSYDSEKKEINIGNGIIGRVETKVWKYKVSNTRVVESWIKYRLKDRFGKKTSPLDQERLDRWLPSMTEELLNLLWIIEETVAMDPKLELLLEKVISNPCFSKSEFPKPNERECQTPKKFGSKN